MTPFICKDIEDKKIIKIIVILLKYVRDSDRNRTV